MDLDVDVENQYYNSKGMSLLTPAPSLRLSTQALLLRGSPLLKPGKALRAS